MNTSGTITTIAGNGTCGFTGDGGQATSAQISGPQGIALDSAGNMFFSTQHRIRKVNTSGIISTVAGTATSGFSGDGGQATAAKLASPHGVAIDGQGNLFISDQNNHRIRKVNTSGIISTFAGTGVAGYGGDAGPATSAKLFYPSDIKVDSQGILFIADKNNNRIRWINGSGIIRGAAAIGVSGFWGDGGWATWCNIKLPEGIAIDSQGNVFIADTSNQRIRKFSFADVNTVIVTSP